MTTRPTSLRRSSVSPKQTSCSNARDALPSHFGTRTQGSLRLEMRMAAGRVKTGDGLKVSSIHLLGNNLQLKLTTGDKWAYSFDIVHDVSQLIEKRGGKVEFVRSLEEHFNGGHNDHTNEVRVGTVISCLSAYCFLSAFPSYSLPLCALGGCLENTRTSTRSRSFQL